MVRANTSVANSVELNLQSAGEWDDATSSSGCADCQPCTVVVSACLLGSAWTAMLSMAQHACLVGTCAAQALGLLCWAGLPDEAMLEANSPRASAHTAPIPASVHLFNVAMLRWTFYTRLPLSPVSWPTVVNHIVAWFQT